MRIAVITPTQLLDTFADEGDAYHLCLSANVMNDSRYAHFYRNAAQRGDFVILDNSAHEQLEGDSIQTLLYAARETNAAEIVLPDRLFFGDDTYERSAEAYSILRAKLADTRLMGVPQGRTKHEWKHCLVRLLALGIDTVGISKDYEVWEGGLEDLVLETLYLVRATARPVEIHMLGWGRELHQLAGLAHLVRGVDSAKPIVYALEGVRLPDVITRSNTPRYPRRSGGFFASHIPTADFVATARHNIETFRRAARGAGCFAVPFDAAANGADPANSAKRARTVG